MEPAAAAAAAAAEAAAFGPTHYQQHYAALMASYNRDDLFEVCPHMHDFPHRKTPFLRWQTLAIFKAVTLLVSGFYCI